MLENLTERLTGILNRLHSKGRLTDKDIDEALGQVRRSLLEADVNFRVARDFVNSVKERGAGRGHPGKPHSRPAGYQDRPMRN